MRPLYEIHSAALDFEFLVQSDVKNLKRHRKRLVQKKDISQIKNILKALGNLEDDISRYKKMD